jgi:hypothetical protein
MKQSLDKTNKRKPDARMRPVRLVVRREFRGTRSAADALLPVIAQDIEGRANRTLGKGGGTP